MLSSIYLKTLQTVKEVCIHYKLNVVKLVYLHVRYTNTILSNVYVCLPFALLDAHMLMLSTPYNFFSRYVCMCVGLVGRIRWIGIAGKVNRLCMKTGIFNIEIHSYRGVWRTIYTIYIYMFSLSDTAAYMKHHCFSIRMHFRKQISADCCCFSVVILLSVQTPVNSRFAFIHTDTHIHL